MVHHHWLHVRDLYLTVLVGIILLVGVCEERRISLGIGSEGLDVWIAGVVGSDVGIPGTCRLLVLVVGNVGGVRLVNHIP